MNNIDYTMHCHTSRCGHAYGEDEEYVLAAIEKGFKTLGFSDHIPLPKHPQPGMRMDISLAEDYFASVNRLKAAYANQIEIHLGYEAEYFESDYHEYYRSLLESGKIDYLILGEHNFIKDGRIHFFCEIADERELLGYYVKMVIEALASGLFLYVAHPDYGFALYHGWDAYKEECARKLAQAFVKYDAIAEVNMGHSHNPKIVLNVGEANPRLPYPDPVFWDIMSQYKVKTTIGVDAHSPLHITNANFAYFRWFVEEHRLNYVGCPRLKKRF